jgi:hypothetical protein
MPRCVPRTPNTPKEGISSRCNEQDLDELQGKGLAGSNPAACIPSCLPKGHEFADNPSI